MNYSRIKWALPWLLFTGVCFAVAPYIFHLADLERGYNATGGEIFLPLLPLVVWMFVKTYKEIAQEIKTKKEGLIRMIQCKNECPLNKVEGVCCVGCLHAEGCPEQCELQPETCEDAIFKGAALEVFKGQQAAVIEKISSLVKQKAEIENAEKEMRKQLQKAMETYDIKQFDNDIIRLTFVEASTRSSVDSTKLKNKYPDIAAECTKSSPTKAFVSIELKEIKNNEWIQSFQS